MVVIVRYGVSGACSRRLSKSYELVKLSQISMLF